VLDLTPAPPRPRHSPEQLRELYYRLSLDRAHVRSRGHDWDVADVRAVFEQWNVDLSA
jgi:hypothetical protein